MGKLSMDLYLSSLLTLIFVDILIAILLEIREWGRVSGMMGPVYIIQRFSFCNTKFAAICSALRRVSA